MEKKHKTQKQSKIKKNRIIYPKEDKSRWRYKIKIKHTQGDNINSSDEDKNKNYRQKHKPKKSFKKSKTTKILNDSNIKTQEKKDSTKETEIEKTEPTIYIKEINIIKKDNDTKKITKSSSNNNNQKLNNEIKVGNKNELKPLSENEKKDF